MTIQPTDSDTKLRIRTFLNDSARILQDIQDLREGLSDVVKNLAQELSVEPKVVRKAMTANFKQSIMQDKETLDEVENFLASAGI